MFMTRTPMAFFGFQRISKTSQTPLLNIVEHGATELDLEGHVTLVKRNTRSNMTPQAGIL